MMGDGPCVHLKSSERAVLRRRPFLLRVSLCSGFWCHPAPLVVGAGEAAAPSLAALRGVWLQRRAGLSGPRRSLRAFQESRPGRAWIRARPVVSSRMPRGPARIRTVRVQASRMVRARSPRMAASRNREPFNFQRRWAGDDTIAGARSPLQMPRMPLHTRYRCAGSLPGAAGFTLGCRAPNASSRSAAPCGARPRSVAQLVRAPVSKTGGWGFESLHSCQLPPSGGAAGSKAAVRDGVGARGASARALSIPYQPGSVQRSHPSGKG